MDLLPAILAVTPNFAGEMLALAKEAHRVRMQLDEVASTIVIRSEGAGPTRVDLSALEGLSEGTARLLWHAVLCSVGTAADWRGTVAVSRLARQGHVGARCQISGGIEVVRERTTVAIRRRAPGRVVRPVRLAGDATFDRWRFRRQPEATIRRDVTEPLPADPWMAALPAGSRLTIRSWVPGDRMDVDGKGHARRVKRFFADARIVGPHRAGWPVVLVEDRIVWIPGVRRSPSADRIVSGSSIVYRCERHPG
jgi:tRNA(Ile)-lysidine synthase